MQVRYFAAAKAALGRAFDTLDAPTLGDLEARLVADAPDAAAVLTRCSYLVDGTSTRDRAMSLTGVTRVDVLPPFAGG
ncbi:MoaD/ThiS family protein [Microbacteriaceae bacterium VKM Ac-2854]|nr:MoaD/ThiS family protein [Microbacteriaceae bacterium VKM Ac-2854]